MECWLRNNHRVMLLGMILPANLTILGMVAAAGVFSPIAAVRVTGIGLAIAAGCVWTVFLWNIRLPRLAYEDGHLLVYLRNIRPIAVPIQYVECFFLGQTTTLVQDRSGNEIDAQTVVVRLAESATQWERCEVKPSLGSWCDGYITIRGMWCEPLTIQRVNQLNRRLAEIHRQLQSEA
ncbi:MAG: hypothetical protein MK179_07685 [Pirellulaceae bacterium]|nr:hypothetical protein [Pirellulaceae bacterium]